MAEILNKSLLSGLILMVSACTWVPQSAPTQAYVTRMAKSKENKANLDYKLLAMTPDIADILASETPPHISTLYQGSPRLGRNDKVGPGDILEITIFELGNGLFSSPDRSMGAINADSSSSSGNAPHITSQTLPPTQVEGDGTILVPYAGRLRVAGLPPTKIAMLIQSRLVGKSQDPQVMVGIKNDIGNTVIVSGEVSRPGRVVLSLADERLSDVIAIAGGAKNSPNDTQIELVRAGRVGYTDLATLENHPEEDIRADPGDRIRAIYQPRSFTAFGAVGQTQQRNEVRFGTATLTLADALGRIGGPSDQRADPNAIYLIRYEDAAVSQRLNLANDPSLVAKRHMPGVPVVYEIDLMDPTQYFLAQRIPMKNHDVILIADAATDRFFKINQLIGTLLGEGTTAGLYAVR